MSSKRRRFFSPNQSNCATPPPIGARLGLLVLLCLAFAPPLSAQKLLSKKDLRGEWFVANADSAFFRSDTLLLIQRSQREQRDDIPLRERNYLEPRAELVGSSSFANLHFHRDGRVEFWESTENGAFNSTWVKAIHWQLHGNRLSILSADFEWHFEVLNQPQQQLVWFEVMVRNYPEMQYRSVSTPSMQLRRLPSSSAPPPKGTRR